MENYISRSCLFKDDQIATAKTTFPEIFESKTLQKNQNALVKWSNNKVTIIGLETNVDMEMRKIEKKIQESHKNL